MIVDKQTNTSSKSTIETLEKGMKYAQTNNKDTNDVNDVVLVPLLLTLNIFRFLFLMFLLNFLFSTVDFKWVMTFDRRNNKRISTITHLPYTITCLKSTTESLEKGVKYVQS